MEYFLELEKKEIDIILHLVDFWDLPELHDKIVKQCMLSEGFYETPTYHAKGRIWWIEKLLKEKANDERYLFSWKVLIPYFKNIQKLTIIEGAERYKKWLELCEHPDKEMRVKQFKYSWIRTPEEIKPISFKSFERL